MTTKGIAARNNPIVRRRLRTDRMVRVLSVTATAAGLLLLAWILGYLLFKGVATLSFSLFTLNTPPPGSAGGLANAIVGSLLITGVGILIATPIGILAGTFLIEYGRGGALAEIIRFVNDMLVSAPSIIIGLFIYQVVVVPMHHASGWAGSIALGIIALPIIVPHDTGHAAAGSRRAARGGLCAGRAQMAGHRRGELSRGVPGHADRRAAGRRADQR